MKCCRCGKDIVEYKEKRQYFDCEKHAHVVEYICKDCFISHGKVGVDL